MDTVSETTKVAATIDGKTISVDPSLIVQSTSSNTATVVSTSSNVAAADTTSTHAPPLPTILSPLVHPTPPAAAAATSRTSSKHKLQLIIPLVSVSGLVIFVTALLLVRKARKTRRLKVQAEPPALPLQHAVDIEPSFYESHPWSKVSAMISLSRNPEVSTMATMGTLTSDPSVGDGAKMVSRIAMTLAEETKTTRLGLQESTRTTVNIASLPDVEHTRQENLTRMLAADPAPSFRARFARRSRSRRRRAVDGGVPVNRSGFQRSGSPVPTTVSTLATGDSIGASTLPPAYAQYN